MLVLVRYLKKEPLVFLMQKRKYFLQPQEDWNLSVAVVKTSYIERQ